VKSNTIHHGKFIIDRSTQQAQPLTLRIIGIQVSRYLLRNISNRRNSIALEWRPHAGEDGDTSYIIRGHNRLAALID